MNKEMKKLVLRTPTFKEQAEEKMPKERKQPERERERRHMETMKTLKEQGLGKC